MAELPRYPETDTHQSAPHAPRDSSSGTPWAAYVMGTIVVIVVVGMVVLHLAGVIGPGTH